MTLASGVKARSNESNNFSSRPSRQQFQITHPSLTEVAGDFVVRDGLASTAWMSAGFGVGAPRCSERERGLSALIGGRKGFAGQRNCNLATFLIKSACW